MKATLRMKVMPVMGTFTFCLVISSALPFAARTVRAGSEESGKALAGQAQAAKTPVFEAREVRRDFGVGYAVTTGDVNGDKKVDVIAISGTQLVWFENPSWTQHVVLDGQTPKDNVALAAQDIDGDGRLDVALAAAWNPRDTNGGGTLHWVRQPGGSAGASAAASSAAAASASPAASPWALIDIASEPTLHRIRWANVDGRGLPELIVAPLHGRGTNPPEWNGPGSRLLVFSIPSKVAGDSKWPVEVADDSLHIFHNFAVVRWDEDDRDDLITSSREGVHLLQRGAGANGKWTRTKLGEGAPGEIKLGRVGGRRIIATIEPWHGNSAVLYLEPERGAAPQAGAGATLWTRRVIEEQLAGGHALGWADFDGDGDDELAVGWRDKEGGLAIYDIGRDGGVTAKHMIDAGGMATEDLTVADLDGDGRPDIAASGRRTSNVKIYFNRTPK